MTDQCQFCVFGPKMLDKCEYYHARTNPFDARLGRAYE